MSMAFFPFSRYASVLFRWVAALAVISALMPSCSQNLAHEAAVAPQPVRMIPVTTRETSEQVKGFGSLSFLKKFELSSPVDGVLESLYFREGEQISRGDIVALVKNPQINLAARRAEDAYSQALSALDIAMARLRDSEYSAEARFLSNEKSRDELRQAEISLEEGKRKSQNLELLYEAGGISDEAIREERFRLSQAVAQIALMEQELAIREVGLRERDLSAAGFPIPSGKDELRLALIALASSAIRAEEGAARANLEAASREMESCRLLESELVIKSPGSGIIGARYIEEGERLRRDDRLLTILDMASLYAVFPVPESDAPKLRKGMAAQVFSGGEELYEGKVDLVFPQADNQSFTFMVRILLAPGDGSPLKPGMFARVSIPLDNPRKAVVIPEAALAMKKDNSGKVFTVRSNVLSERNVVLGSRLGDEREILSGLIPGEVVALGHASILREGAYVSEIN